MAFLAFFLLCVFFQTVDWHCKDLYRRAASPEVLLASLFKRLKTFVEMSVA